MTHTTSLQCTILSRALVIVHAKKPGVLDAPVWEVESAYCIGPIAAHLPYLTVEWPAPYGMRWQAVTPNTARTVDAAP